MPATPRSHQVMLIESAENRDQWLAAQIDVLDDRLDSFDTKLTAILAGVVGLLVTTLTTAITLLLSSGI